jgi:tRNA threonylcarbamoyladenosine biosynthesis protein TsaE
MSNAERGSRNAERPAGKTGRPFSRSWWVAALVYGAGYAFGFFSMAITVGMLFQELLPRFSVDPIKAVRYSLFLLIEPLVIIGFWSRLGDKWKQTLVEDRVPGWYLLATGLVTSGIAVVAMWGVLLTPASSTIKAVFVYALMYGGPMLGIWWVLRYRPRPVDPDYDDAMSGDVRGADLQFELSDLAATEAFGRRLGDLLFPNAVVALVGPLGAGKTQLSRAVAEGLDIANPAAVTSPTFTLIHEYPARLPIFHFDAYRLNGPNEFLDLGVSEYYESGGVCLIEWADKVEAALPAERLTIRLVPLDENRRRAEVVGTGERYERLARRLEMAREPEPEA